MAHLNRELTTLQPWSRSEWLQPINLTEEQAEINNNELVDVKWLNSWADDFIDTNTQKRYPDTSASILEVTLLKSGLSIRIFLYDLLLCFVNSSPGQFSEQPS
jgi:hypothetical protein